MLIDKVYWITFLNNIIARILYITIYPWFYFFFYDFFLLSDYYASNICHAFAFYKSSINQRYLIALYYEYLSCTIIHQFNCAKIKHNNITLLSSVILQKNQKKEPEGSF